MRTNVLMGWHLSMAGGNLLAGEYPRISGSKEPGRCVMKKFWIAVVGAALAFGPAMCAQDVVTGAKDVGKDVGKGTKKAADKTADATVDTSKTVAKGTTTGAKATAHGTTKAADKTADATKDAAKKTADAVK